MRKLAEYKGGRVVLHILALVVDLNWKWHIAGIKREFIK